VRPTRMLKGIVKVFLIAAILVGAGSPAFADTSSAPPAGSSTSNTGDPSNSFIWP
jgi:hypothetical protein